MMNAEMVKNIVGMRLALIPEENRPDINDFLPKLMKQMSDHEIKYWNGYKLGRWFDPEIGKYAYDKWVPRTGDILIASYPKTGTTWTREIIRHIIYRNQPQVLKNTNLPFPIFDYLSWGPKEKFEIVDKFPMERRVFATHLPLALINTKKYIQAGVKIIYTIRNPKDQAASFYNFHKVTQVEGSSALVSSSEMEFYDDYFAGKFTVHAKPGEGYLEHVREWYDVKNDPNVLFLVYEDLIQDFSKQLKRICDFIGEDLTEKEFDFVISKVKFATMKKDNEVLLSLNIFNQGKCGNWKSHLTEEQSKIVDEKVEKILGNTDIIFKYEI